MRQRIIVGLLAIPLTLLPIWLGGVWSALFFSLVALGGGVEFYRLTRVGGYHPTQFLGLIWVVLLVNAYWQPTYLPLETVLIAGLIVTLVDAMYEKQQPMHTWMATAIGALYLGTTVGQALALRFVPNGLWWLIFGLIVTWTNDSAAYFVGVTLGRHKLWPRLSPKKTWEGTVAGWIAAAVVGGLLVELTPVSPSLGIWFGVVVGALCGVLALLGDLSISALKRQVGAKDSGNFLPGHGGVLDRMDSLLFVLPFVYQMVTLLA